MQHAVRQSAAHHRLAIPAVAALLVVGFAQAVLADKATVYQCTQPDGTVVFSGKPCGPDAKKLTIDAPSAGTGSEEAMKGIEEMARQYDEQQRQEREAAARARALRQQSRQGESAPQDRTIYMPSYLPYPFQDRGWSAHGSGKGWHFDIGSGVRPPRHDRHHDHDRPRSDSPFRQLPPSRFPAPPPAYLSPSQ